MLGPATNRPRSAVFGLGAAGVAVALLAACSSQSPTSEAPAAPAVQAAPAATKAATLNPDAQNILEWLISINTGGAMCDEYDREGTALVTTKIITKNDQYATFSREDVQSGLAAFVDRYC